VWAVDEMIANNGWHYFDMPSCVAPGQYLMRVELLALHSAYSAGGAQFYMECAQVEVTGSGSNTGAGSNLVSFPGAYPANDPGIVLNIYGTGGVADNGGKPYPIPGPDPITCSGGNNGGGSNNPGTPPSSTSNPTPTGGSGSGGGSVPLYGQCGGSGYSGPTTCAQGTCKAQNQYYSQCLP
jgi:cellulase